MTQKTNDYIPVPRQFIPYGYSSENLFMLEAKGNGLIPNIFDGDTLLCALDIEEDTTAIKVVVNDGNYHCRMSLDKGYKLIGRVVGIFRDLTLKK